MQQLLGLGLGSGLICVRSGAGGINIGFIPINEMDELAMSKSNIFFIEFLLENE
jgi:hypothetical protein